MTNKMVALVSCGNEREAVGIARRLVEGQLAACVNVSAAPVRSVYRWKGKVEEAKEYLLVIKTTRRLFPRVERQVRELHSYQTPEVIGMSIAAGSRKYLRWMDESLRTRRR